jgi:hypothetical protein
MGVRVGHAYDAFISYAHADIEWVTNFAKRLEDDGIRVARDEMFLQPGDILVHAVEQAIRDSAHGIVVFSSAAVSSDWVPQEYAVLMRRSIENGRRFIPVRIDDVELPEFAATRLGADFRDAGDRRYDWEIARIARALRS